jgi:hypothetical protein
MPNCKRRWDHPAYLSMLFALCFWFSLFDCLLTNIYLSILSSALVEKSKLNKAKYDKEVRMLKDMIVLPSLLSEYRCKAFLGTAGKLSVVTYI